MARSAVEALTVTETAVTGDDTGSLTLCWDPPAEAGGDTMCAATIEYTLGVKESSTLSAASVSLSSTRCIEIPFLKLCTEYTISVTPANCQVTVMPLQFAEKDISPSLYTAIYHVHAKRILRAPQWSLSAVDACVLQGSGPMASITGAVGSESICGNNFSATEDSVSSQQPSL